MDACHVQVVQNMQYRPINLQIRRVRPPVTRPAYAALTSAPCASVSEIDTVSELPASAHQLRHLGKARPRRAKSRAPTRPVVGEEAGGLDSGLEAFFPPARSLPSSPLTSPDSESRCAVGSHKGRSQGVQSPLTGRRGQSGRAGSAQAATGGC